MHAPPDRPAPSILSAPPVVALAGWVVPGLGYWLAGERARGYVAGLVILATFALGVLIGGIRVIDVPGYDALGHHRLLRLRGGDAVWAFKANPVGEVFAKPWYIAQCLTGPALTAGGTWGSLKAAAAGHPMSTARVFDIGTLYTAVAGMLNLLVVIDATYRAANRDEHAFSAVPRPDAPAFHPGDPA